MHVEGVKRVHVNSKNVFTSVYHFVHRGRGPLEALWGVSTGSASRGVCLQGQLHPGGMRLAGSARGSVYRGIYIEGRSTSSLGGKTPATHHTLTLPPPLADLGKRAVHILLECFLVLKFGLNFLRHD